MFIFFFLFMASKVFFSKVSASDSDDVINGVVEKLLVHFSKAQSFKFDKKMFLKVSFGEEGNKTFIPSKWMVGAIDFLKNKGVETAFIETNVLYRGLRTNKKDHVALAKKHGFTQLPIIIADGDIGGDAVDVKIDSVHFKSCSIAKKIVDESQLLVVSHFKGHVIAGFGGAIKQLGMGCASRGGKLAQHVGSAPLINPLSCTKCGVCVKNCHVHAISIGRLSARIDKNVCTGCAACIALCPHNAVKINWLSSLTNNFSERLVEYAYASQLNKKNIYLTYAINMTKECDCIGHEMKPIIPDIGIFISDDPVACDRAILDLINKRNNKRVFSEKNTFFHAKHIGFGSVDYVLREL
jgi:uncharacterized protein